MPRQIKFDLTESLASATELFLRKGYDAASMGELVKTTGINRHSMYNTFGDKEGLFLACIDHYTLETRNLKTVQILSRKPLGVKNIKAFLKDRIDYALSDNCYGCLLVNTVSERETVSTKINQKIDKLIANQERLIFDCIKAAINNNEISVNNDAEALADYFSCFFRGLMNMAKGSPKKISSYRKMEAMALCAIEV